MFRAVVHRCVLVSLSCKLSNVVTAQNSIGTLESVNALFDNQYVMQVKRNVLIIDGFREGEQVKQDRVNVFDLNLKTLEFSSTEKAVIIRCHNELDECVTKVLMRERRKKTYRNRIVFSVDSEKTGSELKSLLNTLIGELQSTR